MKDNNLFKYHVESLILYFIINTHFLSLIKFMIIVT